MKHTLTDRPDVFRFHDANLTLVAWDGDCLTLCAEHLILGKEANPDHPDTDMELSATLLTLFGIRVTEFELERAWVTDENGGNRYISPMVLYSGIAARDRFREELCRTVRVIDLCEEDGLYELSACGTEPYFTVRFRISGVRAEFDGYRKKAWYEMIHETETQVTLSTADGDVRIPLHIRNREQDPTGEEPSGVTVSTVYQGKTLYGNGRADAFGEALASLARVLPDGTSVRCCFTCRYGSPCAGSGVPGNVACTNDFRGTGKGTAASAAGDGCLRDSRVREGTDVCGCYCKKTSDG